MLPDTRDLDSYGLASNNSNFMVAGSEDVLLIISVSMQDASFFGSF